MTLQCYHSSLNTQRWLSARLDLIGAFIVFAAALFNVIAKGSVKSSTAGLAITYAISISQALTMMVRNFSELESQFSSVERIMFYVNNVPNEDKAIVHENRPPKEWPQHGSIEFKDYSMKYRPNLPPVLHDLNFSVKAGESIGVCGRTAAGKSSLFLTLFRMSPFVQGKIFIDGLDISTIGLQDLRRKIAIIPQEPTLFTGTVRSNLDPFNEFSDAHIWNVLEKAHLKHTVEMFADKLQHKVTENGGNFSVGERQLLCLARALTRQVNLLILDEATASVDFETDSLIQKTVREEFKHCTRLTIAHRLNTIIDSDRILVLDKGAVVEYDTPKNLVLNEKSIFTGMINETGPANAEALKMQAIYGTRDASKIAVKKAHFIGEEPSFSSHLLLEQEL